jgi:hypothetical protein
VGNCGLYSRVVDTWQFFAQVFLYELLGVH